MHCVKSLKKKKKNAYWGHTTKNSGQKWDFAILELSTCTSIGVTSFGFDPGFEQWWPTTAQSIFQIEKRHSGSLWTRVPPFAAENPVALNSHMSSTNLSTTWVRLLPVAQVRLVTYKISKLTTQNTERPPSPFAFDSFAFAFALLWGPQPRILGLTIWSITKH